MVKPQPILRPLHPCGPNCELLNQVGKDLANLRELVPKLAALKQEEPEKSSFWDGRYVEAFAMLVDYEVRYAAMVKVRDKALKIFRKLRPSLSPEGLQKERQANHQPLFKPEVEDRFESLIDELEDLVFELAVTGSDDELKREELLSLVDAIFAQIQMVVSNLGLDKYSADIREAALQIAKQPDDAQTAVEEAKAKPL